MKIARGTTPLKSDPTSSPASDWRFGHAVPIGGRTDGAPRVCAICHAPAPAGQRSPLCLVRGRAATRACKGLLVATVPPGGGHARPRDRRRAGR